MKLGRNESCHCGSGRKYKKCHLASDVAEARPKPQERIAVPQLVHHICEKFLASNNVDEERLELAEQYFAERDAGRGPAQQMMDFAQPLIEKSDGTVAGLSKAMSIAMVFWNLAITPERDREQMMTATMSKDAGSEVLSEFQIMAELMIARHEAMFPELHHSR